MLKYNLIYAYYCIQIIIISAIGNDLKGYSTRIYCGANFGRSQSGHKERRRLLLEVSFEMIPNSN